MNNLYFCISSKNNLGDDIFNLTLVKRFFLVDNVLGKPGISELIMIIYVISCYKCMLHYVITHDNAHIVWVLHILQDVFITRRRMLGVNYEI